MSKILELREKRAKAWEAAKAFLDSRRGNDGLVSAEDAAVYDKMEADIVNLGKEISRLERQEALEAELNKPINTPLTGKPVLPDMDEKVGRASDEYKKAFWNVMRMKNPRHDLFNALSIGQDSEGGYLVPDEFERTLIQNLEEENIFRKLAKIIQTSSGDRKIPIVVTKGTASWLDEGEDYDEDDVVFGQASIGAYKLGTMIKVSEELLNDSVFNIEEFISTEFARRIGAKEEEAFLVGDGEGKIKTGIRESFSEIQPFSIRMEYINRSILCHCCFDVFKRCKQKIIKCFITHIIVLNFTCCSFIIYVVRGVRNCKISLFSVH
jgi:HK97 family phage major capsid protein